MMSYANLNYLLRDHKNGFYFVIWGVGGRERKLCRTLSLLDVPVKYFINTDEKNECKEIYGIPVCTVYDLLYEKEQQKMQILCFGRGENTICLLESVGIDVVRQLKDAEFYQPAVHNDVSFLLDPILGYVKPSYYKGICGLSGYGIEDAEITIVTLGGSTTDDMQWSIKSWSQILQERAVKEGKSVRIICAGVAGYNIYQELNQLIRDVLVLDPDIVIDYSGANQCGNGVLEGYPNIHDYQKMLFERLRVANKSSFYIGNLVSEVNYGAKSKGTLFDNYQLMTDIMYSICKNWGIAFVSYFQPVLAYKDKFAPDEKEKILNSGTIPLKKNKVYNQYKQFQADYEKSEKREYQTNLSHLFDDKNVYFTDVHVIEEGNQILADAIWKDLKSRRVIL